MKILLLLAMLLGATTLTGCGDKNDPEHFSATGMFNRTGGDVCNAQVSAQGRC